VLCACACSRGEKGNACTFTAPGEETCHGSISGKGDEGLNNIHIAGGAEKRRRQTMESMENILSHNAGHTDLFVVCGFSNVSSMKTKSQLNYILLNRKICSLTFGILQILLPLGHYNFGDYNILQYIKMKRLLIWGVRLSNNISGYFLKLHA
jgi:hypothetical protein